MSAALAMLPRDADAPVSWASSARYAAAPGATGSTSGRRRARLPSRSGTRCRNCWRASSAGRGVEVDEVEAFLDPTVRRLMPDPHTVTAMEQAAQRLADAMMQAASRSRSSATTTSTAPRPRRCWRASCGIGGTEPIVHIPDRIFEGYGPNVEAIRALAERGATLLVTVDCGTASIEPLAEARRLGLDVIVLDHHQADEKLPDAIVVNPNRLDDLSGLGHLAAVGLVFMAVVAINRVLRTRGFWTEARPEPDLLGWLDIVALGTVADVVPLKGLNRAFVAKGLIAMRRRDNVGLTALMDVARLSGPPEPFHLGFLLGPRINAGGRIGRADLGAQLLRTDDPVEAGRIAAELDRLNRERRAMEVGDAGGGRSRGAGRARHRGEGRGGGDGGGELASGRGRAARGAAEGALQPAGLRHRARAGRHRHRLGPLDPRRRSRPDGAARGRPRGCCSRAAATPWPRASR